MSLPDLSALVSLKALALRGCKSVTALPDLSHLSELMTLHPGDVISTGTPPGVGMGMKPKPVFLQEGDVMELTIDGLGRQRQEVGRDPA